MNFDPAKQLRQIALAMTGMVLVLGLACGCDGAAAAGANERLAQAVMQGDIEAAKWLLETGASADAVATIDGMKIPVAQIAVVEGKADVLRLLLEHGADPNQAGDEPGTLLHTAAFVRDDAVIGGLLLKHTVWLEARDASDETALHIAARRGHGAFVGLLINKGADMEKRRLGFTALMLAAFYRHDEIASLLMSKGAYYDVLSASMLGDLERVRALVSGGQASPTRMHPHAEMTPFFAAAHRRRTNVMAFLISKGADVNARASERYWGKDAFSGGQTALENAIDAKDLATSTFLLDHGADPHLSGKNDALQRAAFVGANDIVELLKKRGSTMTVFDQAFVGDLESVRRAVTDDPAALNRRRVNSAWGEGYTLLHCAARNGHVKLATYLVGAGCLIDAADHVGQTPLFLAVKAGNVSTVRLLLENNANPLAQDRLGNSLRDCAAIRSDPAIMDLLEKFEKSR